MSDEPGLQKLPIPPKGTLTKDAKDVLSGRISGRQEIHAFTDSTKSPAKADFVIKGLHS